MVRPFPWTMLRCATTSIFAAALPPPVGHDAMLARPFPKATLLG
eukprot:CAMPEP_0118961372 /NCGR_PEP_ID=MMETSP1173-20130426/59_1 /TAXON_ID=1034831 /ORGANISM="Rhizochromulina marina cf, Strain CCMP1243" /LENGTH=43 /DNA_ID= /DNA_START= /DNA_END= /DNA_ORIENTATION=